MLRKIENWLFYLFLFAIPISVRHIFHYEPFQFVEWTAVYVYATDILFAALVIFALWQKLWPAKGLSEPSEARTSAKSSTILTRSRWRLKFRTADWFLFAFIIIAGISIKNAIDTNVAIFQWLKLIEGVVLYFYVKEYALKRFDIKEGFTWLVVGGVFQSVIAIIQFVRQGSLGLKYLGESVLVPAMSGIAAFYTNGIKIMRAYGTTPHSNVLAAFLFLAIGAFYFGSIYTKKSRLAYVAYAIMLWALFATFSRTIIFFWAFGFGTRALLIAFDKEFRADFWQKPEPRKRLLAILGITVSVVVVFAAVYWPYVISRASLLSTDEAVQLRVLYNHESLHSGHNLFGLGMGNFVPWLMRQDLHLDRGVYQPVHNIYLLIYSETGILGISTFLIFIGLLWADFYKRLRFRWLRHFSFALIIGSVLAFGLFDHFLWTIQSGRLMFWLVLGFLAAAE